MASELEPCPFCSKTMMLRSALWPSEGDADAIIHADPTDCPMLGFSDGSADGSIIEKWDCSLSNEDDFPSDGSCVRCGSVPRNANGLCNTCLDEDAERIENTRPTPVTPVSPDADGKCGELVTVGYGYVNSLGELEYAHATSSEMRTEALCRRSQAGSIIAELQAKAKDYREYSERLVKRLESEEATRSQVEELLAAERADHDNTIATLSSLIEDNAALTARIKELERVETELCTSIGLLEDKLNAANGKIEALVQSLAYETAHEATKRAEALEAKLAAAEQALKTARPYVEDYDTRRHNTGVDETLTQIDAVLGGKPS
ncbi:hypothetical protein V19_42 [Brucella phage V_19]|uniref:Uncharacterized protein n=17 Tax=Perisivirus Tb TaxID=1984800 RepID=A0A0H4IN71_9CAUD|nr:hypothetical protein p0219_42 [Brucella phage 02_19]AKO59088.1 hypothetical protein p02141_42 [Brucella phage 02_141]AKO59145.1 hypothetical protein p11sa19_42 [Brucella phage 11sa_19]AKO59262.1 hypothetical protein p11019_42 [Brucella phage 110_19]AKO59320.1 hypothetical protein p110141_42 [Brucella phage 110_141]AKO59378.1 hypothetical protein p14119_42 [Brucella phage 141_19]AKO59434.1 hypothetical protein p141141_42 [Brucella phage 141_141]AKO59493.1 hypothetical protein p17719_42 [Br